MIYGNVLAIETSTPRGSIAVVSQEGEVLFSEDFESDRSHNSLLFAPLQRAFDCGQSFDAILVGIGPGSYTGVRIGISAALGISLAREVPVAGISSLCALELSPADGSYNVIGDARRGAFYCVEIRKWQPVAELTICSSDDLELLVSANALRVLTCDGGGLPIDALVTFPHASRLAHAACFQELNFSATIEPIYLRPPYVTTPKQKVQ